MSDLNQKSSEVLAGVLTDLILTKFPTVIESLSSQNSNLRTFLMNTTTEVKNITDKLYEFNELSDDFYEPLLSESFVDLVENIKRVLKRIEENDYSKTIGDFAKIESGITQINNIFKKQIPLRDDFENESYINLLIKNINENLSEKDIEFLNLKGRFNILPYEEKEKVYRKLILLRNTIKNNSYDVITKDLILDSINDIFTHHENAIQSQTLVKNLEETAQNINISISERSNKEILKAFEDEAKALKIEIVNLNYLVISLFWLIIAVLFFKGILAIFFDYAFRDVYNIFIFITIVFSMSALLTYVIKERTRNVKLHDFYNRRYLELNALPEFISELTPEERRTLIKELAHAYFNGGQFTPHEDSSESKITELNKQAEDLKKLIENIKSIIK
ncbi:hypothetical protein [Acinetobacter dispersus]|uniref:hypothetical protein n=1 Tax=Acinetobacter dispersus TaxID=70348 RepID=UPI001F4AB1AE|nr:hypothetical protein [Acinetobacter dispersus]MCH7392412.1 hypothetical protein [Acinetobacter dispersus]